MRKEIKFRAWHEPSNEMVTVNDLAIRIEMINQGNETGMPYSEIKLMQYIGLKDKNGKEIYEGDIVKRYAEETKYGYKKGALMYVAPVVYSNEVCAFVMRKGFDFKIDSKDDLEVVGNVYKTPELLNETQSLTL